MYSKHRQKKHLVIVQQCGQFCCLLVSLCLVLLTSDALLDGAGTAGTVEVQGTPRGQRTVSAAGTQRGQRTVSPAGTQRGRTVTAQWLSEGRSRRETEASSQHPDRGEILLTSNGLELVLQVERNQELLGSEFTETRYTDNGEPETTTTNYTDHCFYQGDVRGHTGSWVVLSTCSGVRGLISLNSSDTYYLEPIAGSEPLRHSLLSTEELPVKKSATCGHCGHQSGHPAHISPLLTPTDHRVKRNTWGTTKYMELYIVADSALYKRQNKDYQKTKLRIMEIANYVDKFYRALNIRVPLIGLEVWTDRDQCMVSEEPNATLWSFLQWRQKLKARRRHDNAQLLTGVIFKGTTIGMAPLEGMCSLENSGGINVDHSELPVGAAATMAHEIGHNFGMSHDHEGCCTEATAEQGGCVMAAATGLPFPRVFSGCSRRDLDGYFQKGGGMCLYDTPDMKDLVGGKRCGNGFVEDGEECDCGEAEECDNNCCNANNCTLKEEAQCAHGVCCERCKLKGAGTMCRGAAGSCDLPEYCTGASPYCPANVYLLDGTACHRGRAYCHRGMCLTHQQQCVQLWGYGARPAHDACFQDVNTAGNAFGNCGKDGQGNYMKCEKSDAKCGKIQCHSAAKKPRGTNAVSIDTTVRTDGVELKCRGTYVYSTQDGHQGDLPDPGLVTTGTKCGEGKVCRDRRCQNTSFTELETCIARCHGNGVCNSNGNCHCNRGWAPPFCEKPGLGGSVDSGPVQYDSQVGVVVGLLLSFLAVLPGVLTLFYCCRTKSSCFHRRLSSSQRQNNGHSDSSVEKEKNGHLNPAFHLKVVGPLNKASSSHKGLPHTSKEVLPLRPAPPPPPNNNNNNTATTQQPVNVVRPSPRDLRRTANPVRPPPLPGSKPRPPTAQPQRLTPPPRKPLPLNPTTTTTTTTTTTPRSPLLVSEQQSRPSPSPPQRPLPLSPLRGPLAAAAMGGPARCPPTPSRPSDDNNGLLVTMPPAVGPKPLGNVCVLFPPPLRALRPVPGAKPNTGSPPSCK